MNKEKLDLANFKDDLTTFILDNEKYKEFYEKKHSENLKEKEREKIINKVKELTKNNLCDSSVMKTKFEISLEEYKYHSHNEIKKIIEDSFYYFEISMDFDVNNNEVIKIDMEKFIEETFIAKNENRIVYR